MKGRFFILNNQGVKILSSDTLMPVEVIFNNLNGQNFTEPSQHESYLRRMFQVTNLQQGEIRLTDIKGNILRKDKIKLTHED